MNPDSRCCRLRLTQQIYKQNLYVGGFFRPFTTLYYSVYQFFGPVVIKDIKKIKKLWYNLKKT